MLRHVLDRTSYLLVVQTNIVDFSSCTSIKLDITLYFSLFFASIANRIKKKKKVLRALSLKLAA